MLAFITFAAPYPIVSPCPEKHLVGNSGALRALYSPKACPNSRTLKRTNRS